MRKNIIFYAWYGGKFSLVKKFQQLLPKHQIFYELYGGSGALTLNNYKCDNRVFNEYSSDIVNLWRTVQDDKLCKKLREELLEISYNKATFKYAHDVVYYSDPVRNALHTLIEIDMSFNSARKGYSNRKCADYGGKKYDLLWHIHKNIKGVRIENMDALELIPDVIGQKDAFLFLDPPYQHEYRSKGATHIYEKEMTSGEHEQLLKVIRDADCMIMLCGYRSGEGKPELYDRILRSGKCGNHWHCYLLAELPAPGIKGAKRQEYIWVNYELPKAAQYLIDTTDVMQH